MMVISKAEERAEKEMVSIQGGRRAERKKKKKKRVTERVTPEPRHKDTIQRTYGRPGKDERTRDKDNDKIKTRQDTKARQKR